MPKEKICWGLVTRRSCLLPTWRGWLLLLSIGAVVAFGLMRGAEPFLAVNAPRPGGVLVVEGWAADYALAAAVAEFNRNHYDKIFVTGGPIEQGAPLSEYKTYAELAAATLEKLGLSTNVVQAVPAPLVPQDRTYTSAVTLREWWQDHGATPATINLLTVGAHARRSRLLFQKAFGKDITVGIIAVPTIAYDPRRWWRSSPGVRTVIGEATAYLYARLLFHPRRHAITKTAGDPPR